MSETRKPNGRKRKDESLSPHEALDMLRSALWYVQQSGLRIAAGCNADMLTLQIMGAKMVTTDSGWELMPIVSDLSANETIATEGLSAQPEMPISA
jgi:hypothetical protein